MPKKYSELSPEARAEYDALSPEERERYRGRVEDDRQQFTPQSAPSLTNAVRPSQPVPIDFAGMGQDALSVLKKLPKTAAGGISGGMGMAMVPGIGQTPMGIGAGVLAGAVGGAFGPDVDTPEGVGANLMNLALPGSMARSPLPNNVIGNFLTNLMAMKTGEHTDRALRTMWPGAAPPPGDTASALAPDAAQLGISAGMAVVPPLFQRLLSAANSPEKLNTLAQFKDYFRNLDIPQAQRDAALAEIDRRLAAHSQDRLAEGQLRMSAARQQNVPELGPMPKVTPQQEATLPPSDVQPASDMQALLQQSLQQAAAKKAGIPVPSVEPQVPAQPKPVDENAAMTTMELVNKLKRSMGMQETPLRPNEVSKPSPTTVPEVPVVQPDYSADTNAILRKMKADGPTDFIRGAFSAPERMARLPQMLDAAEEAGMGEIRTVARGHFIDNMLNAAESSTPREALAKFREFGKQKFGDSTGSDILNDVAGSNEAYHNMNKLYESLEKSQTSDGPLKLFWKRNKAATSAGGLGALMVVQKLTGVHIPAVEAIEGVGMLATGTAAAAGGGYRVMEITADKLGKFIGRKRSSMWDTILDAVEGSGRMTPSVMNAVLGELRRNAADVRVIKEDELDKVKDEPLDDVFK